MNEAVASPLTLPRVQQALAFLALVSLPFTQALTLDIRFPLKIYELALLAAAALTLIELRVRTSASRRERGALVAFLLLAATLLFYRQLDPISTASAVGFTSRFGALGDGMAKLAYLALAIFAFVLLSYHAAVDREKYARAWLLGAILCSIYSWYLFAASLVDVVPPLLPSSSAQRIQIGSRFFIRSGTFEEGNYLGLYLLLSTAVALLAQRRRLAIYLSVTALTAFSTTTLFGLTVLWSGILVFRGDHARGSAKRYMMTALIAGAVLSGLLISGYLGAVVAGKLVGPDAVSRLNRLDFILEGLRMFREHPVAGVGISQYGYQYNSFQYMIGTVQADLHKLIPNNVYVELLAELGIFATGIFLAFIAMLLRRTRGVILRPLRWGLLGMLLVWNAFPSYTLIALWAFFALIVGASVSDRRDAPVSYPALHPTRVAV